MSARPLRMLLFGGCRVQQPIRSVSLAQTRFCYQDYGTVKTLHTVGDVLQTIDLLRGRISIPPGLRSWCNMSLALAPVTGEKDFADLDVALIETSSPIEMKFREWTINHLGVKTRLLNPLRKQGGDAARLAAKWYHKGIKGFDDAARKDAADRLVGHLPSDTEDALLVHDILRETRPQKSDIRGGLRQIRDILGCPIAMVIYIFRYMPDGRAISWPESFVDDVVAAAELLNFPVYDPTPRVLQFGVERAFRVDREYHYAHALLPVIGEDLIRLAESTHQRSIGKHPGAKMQARDSGAATTAAVAEMALPRGAV